MTKDAQRWIGAAFGFAAAVVWTTSGARAALLCVLGAGLCAVLPAMRERKLAVRTATLLARVHKALEKRPAQPLRPKARRPAEPRRTAATVAPSVPPPVSTPTSKLYDRDESGEHVYEVANYGW